MLETPLTSDSYGERQLHGGSDVCDDFNISPYYFVFININKDRTDCWHQIVRAIVKTTAKNIIEIQIKKVKILATSELSTHCVLRSLCLAVLTNIFYN